MKNLFKGKVNAKELLKELNKNPRKQYPVFEGLVKYFPDALMEIARTSVAGNKQHHSNKPLHWDKSKSTDNADAMLRHLIDYGRGIKIDDDGIPHLNKVAWRALALLQIEIENERNTKL